ncbi:Ser Thr protein phosphatase [Amylolactobacillus amylotrophicus DSM 20534]|uniref:Ser Thr protein phosphatase n=3 Tax=Amylolactobacillus TaxID=2767876 RepID=A0A0R1YIX5_9LACO|nr:MULTISPECIES: bifunctional metallophosphatase/5'-nucleotidase [Amylolactobacillus]APT18048.1 multifunctional 2',3'-cyclic-nucleotide 2'-phosphodiesterase/5'-nucleotidase/3'-nucleotidase [Amylolactobacillus amylophilus DSM 20533 = JCM 1125]KRK37390.1 Ser Thr protein phosphatase [Amylolactobacillus amylotrophicus DSM 20534]KRM42063.1 Ser Thr protein phosphatase [Amylolactobacillus amylophilus DSM 20533 = JCM 1125]GED80596.1 multifunctional 2',3'-cyclic-nucleotide 2'-phosphodiesterase/5'-nucleo
MESIRIVHTNDLHSHFENWPVIRRYIERAQKDETVSQTLTFDLGDFMDRSHPLTDATDGGINIELMNNVHYDGATIGNNEGIGNPHAILEHLFDHANFDILLGNLFEQDGKRPAFCQPYKIITTKMGTRIAVLGLTAAYPLTYEPNGWDIHLITDVLPGLLAELRGQYDYLILLSHLGITMDKYLANEFKELNLIIGSHTHHLLENGLVVNQSMLAAAGKWGRYIGDIRLEFDVNHQLVQQQVNTVKTADLQTLPGDAKEIAGYVERGEALLAHEHVATLPASYAAKKTEMADALHAIAQTAGTNLAILNTGLFVQQLQPGLLTMNDLHQGLPHPMHVVRVKLRGEDLWRLVMEMEKNRNFLRNFKIKGMSFRGKIFGEIKYLGIEVDQATRTVYVEGQEIDTERDYYIALLDHYVFIPFFPTIEIMGETKFYFPKFFRQVVADYLSHKYKLEDE